VATGARRAGSASDQRSEYSAIVRFCRSRPLSPPVTNAPRLADDEILFESRAVMSFTAAHLFFDDVAIDQEWISQGRTITQADIVNFAGVSGDFNPIHVDHEFAKTTLFRQPIAHGMLVWSVSTGLSVSAPLMRTIAFMNVKEWTFKEPVFIGDTIRTRSKVV